MEMVATLICLGLLPPEVLDWIRPISGSFLPYALRQWDVNFPVEISTRYFSEETCGLLCETMVMQNDKNGTTWLQVCKVNPNGTMEFKKFGKGM